MSKQVSNSAAAATTSARRIGRVVGRKVRAIWRDESAQGATEYILLLVIVVSVALLFRERLTQMVGGRLDALGGALSGFNPQ